MISKLSWGDNFEGLTAYLVENRDCTLLSLQGASSLDRAAAEMQAVADASGRVRKPVMHVSFSAATEDGVLSRDSWLALVTEAEREFGLAGHQHVVVRHHDKDYDHVHVFWCTINEDTGRTPPGQQFRRKGAPHPELDQLAIGDDQQLKFADEELATGSFSRFALSRLQTICRSFERAHDLRRLRDRRAAAAARENGEARPRRSATDHREQRTGRPPVSASADVIRAALDQPDYDRSRAALIVAGFDLDVVVRKRKDGTEEYRGLVVYDLADTGNRAPASSFDVGADRYGMRQLEKRHADGALTIEEWWPVRGAPASLLMKESQPSSIERAIYARLRERHHEQEAKRAAQRRDLARQHRKQRTRLRARLRALRRRRAALLPASQRRAFYAAFARTTRASIWSSMERRHAAERTQYARRRFPTWAEFTALPRETAVSSLAAKPQRSRPGIAELGHGKRDAERARAAHPALDHDLAILETLHKTRSGRRGR